MSNRDSIDRAEGRMFWCLMLGAGCAFVGVMILMVTFLLDISPAWCSIGLLPSIAFSCVAYVHMFWLMWMEGRNK